MNVMNREKFIYNIIFLSYHAFLSEKGLITGNGKEDQEVVKRLVKEILNIENWDEHLHEKNVQDIGQH
jgi:hypothetical protein